MMTTMLQSLQSQSSILIMDFLYCHIGLTFKDTAIKTITNMYFGDSIFDLHVW